MVDVTTLSIMLLPLEDPLAWHVQSQSQDLSSWSIHKSCADVHSKNCKYCHLASWPLLAHSRVETVVLTLPANVHECCDWRQILETWFQKLSSEPPGFQGVYAPMNQCTNPWPWEVLNTKSTAITLPIRVGVLFVSPFKFRQSLPSCIGGGYQSSLLFLQRYCNCGLAVCYPF